MGRTYVLDGFPWELLGYSQATVLPIAQIASVVGVYGLSATGRAGQRRGGLRRARTLIDAAGASRLWSR